MALPGNRCWPISNRSVLYIHCMPQHLVFYGLCGIIGTVGILGLHHHFTTHTTTLIRSWEFVVFIGIRSSHIGCTCPTGLLYIKASHRLGSKVLVVLWYLEMPVLLASPTYRGYKVSDHHIWGTWQCFYLGLFTKICSQTCNIDRPLCKVKRTIWGKFCPIAGI